MTIFTTYRSYAANLVRGIDFLTARFGQRWTGAVGLVHDALMQGATFGFKSGLPGHPEQAEDALNQSGADAGMFRYRGESIASWRARVSDPWAFHEQGGTDVALLRELDIWGAIVYPGTWVAGQCYLIEYQWARFAVFVPTGLLPWGGPMTYGSGQAYGDANLMYGVTAIAEDVATLKRIVRTIKPSRSKARGILVLSGVVYGQRGIAYGSGVAYGADVIRLGF